MAMMSVKVRTSALDFASPGSRGVESEWASSRTRRVLQDVFILELLAIIEVDVDGFVRNTLQVKSDTEPGRTGRAIIAIQSEASHHELTVDCGWMLTRGSHEADER